MTTAANVLKTAEKAVTLAADALSQAQAALAAAGGSVPATQSKPGKRTSKPANDSKGSAGRIPSPEQMKIRQAIAKALGKGLQYFTIAEITAQLGTDRIQTRNAVNYLEQQGAIVRYGEKLPEGRGQRELIYKAGNPETIKAVA